MHETDMTKALILTIREWLAEQESASEKTPERVQIDKVHLTVGEFTCVEPASLQFAFNAQTKGTFLEGVQLQIKEVPLVAFCHSCEQTYRPQVGAHYACPQCQSPMEDIRSGRELKIDRFEVVSEVVSTQAPAADSAKETTSIKEAASTKETVKAKETANKEVLAQSGV